MRIIISAICFFISSYVLAQRDCRTSQYEEQLAQLDPSVIASRNAAENFISEYQSSNRTDARAEGDRIIKIPVIVHILYHYPGENITDEMVRSQLAVLNRDFRKQNPDTIRIPSYFKSFAADCEIE